MAKPWIHAKSSAVKFGGVPEDYVEIHNFMDGSKSALADNRHRCLTHNAWFLIHVLERVKFSNSCEPTGDNRFPTIINSKGRHVSVRDIGEQHISEDFKGPIPTAEDFLRDMRLAPWMNNGEELPPSAQKIANKGKKQFIPFENGD